MHRFLGLPRCAAALLPSQGRPGALWKAVSAYKPQGQYCQRTARGVDFQMPFFSPSAVTRAKADDDGRGDAHRGLQPHAEAIFPTVLKRRSVTDARIAVQVRSTHHGLL